MSAAALKLIRKSGYGDQKVDQLATDVVEALSKQATLEFREFDAVYFEPMRIGGFAAEPTALLAIRIRDMAALESPLLHGTAISFVWEGNGTTRIDTIEGLTVGDKYRFTILALKAVS